MKKIFQTEYPDEIINQITKWLEDELYEKEGKAYTYKPQIIVEIVKEDK